MIASHRSPICLKSGILAACAVCMPSAAVACLNEYKAEEPRQTAAEIAADIARHNTTQYLSHLLSGRDQVVSPRDLDWLKYLAETGDFRAKSNYAVGLARSGDAAKAIKILEEIEEQQPGESIIAGNLGTVYELTGDDRKALDWITTGLRRDPQSHANSEWLHEKILQAKLALAQDPEWLNSHSILGLDFGNADKPTQTLTDLDGQTKSLAAARSALEYQLHERLALVPSPDAIVADLLFALGNLLSLDGEADRAVAVYRLAMGYATNDTTLISLQVKAAIPREDPDRAFFWLQSLIVGLLGGILVAATGLYLKQFIKKPSRSA